MDCVIRQMHVALLQIRAGPVIREEAGPLHYMGADSAVYGFNLLDLAAGSQQDTQVDVAY